MGNIPPEDVQVFSLYWPLFCFCFIVFYLSLRRVCVRVCVCVCVCGWVGGCHLFVFVYKLEMVLIIRITISRKGIEMCTRTRFLLLFVFCLFLRSLFVG